MYDCRLGLCLAVYVDFVRVFFSVCVLMVSLYARTAPCARPVSISAMVSVLMTARGVTDSRTACTARMNLTAVRTRNVYYTYTWSAAFQKSLLFESRPAAMLVLTHTYILWFLGICNNARQNHKPFKVHGKSRPVHVPCCKTGNRALQELADKKWILRIWIPKTRKAVLGLLIRKMS